MIEFLFLFLINLFFIFFFKSIERILNCYDHPVAHRKIHNKKIANFGGFLIIVNIIIFYTFLYKNNVISNQDFFFIIGSVIFFLLGYFDDKLDINAYLKFFFQIIFILLLLFFNNDLLVKDIYISSLNKKILLEQFDIFFTILCYLLFINAFNMLDGINLSAGIYSLLLLVFLYLQKNNILFIVLITSLIFFLIKNYQNKLFLGNNGSTLLGFIFSYFFIDLNRTKIISVEEIFLVMIIPGLDMLRLYIQRIYNKKNPFKADLNHLHHILLKKFNYNIAITYLSLILFTPFFLNLFFDDSKKIYLIIFIVFSYFYLIFYLLKKKRVSNT
jgi:UDP-GlcNAc:undecaprenyl-phosphate GlcNAc-1-phosphate transferase